MAQQQPHEQNSQNLAAALFGAGLDLVKTIGKEALNEACHQVPAGSHEIAAALFNGNGFVMYQRGSKDDPAKENNQEQGQYKDGPDHAQQQEHQHENQQERGRSM